MEFKRGLFVKYFPHMYRDERHDYFQIASLSQSSFFSSSSPSLGALIIIILNIGDGDCNIRRNILRGQSSFIAGFGCSSRSSSSSSSREMVEGGLDRNKPRHHHQQHNFHIQHQHHCHGYPAIPTMTNSHHGGILSVMSNDDDP